MKTTVRETRRGRGWPRVAYRSCQPPPWRAPVEASLRPSPAPQLWPRNCGPADVGPAAGRRRRPGALRRRSAGRGFEPQRESAEGTPTTAHAHQGHGHERRRSRPTDIYDPNSTRPTLHTPLPLTQRARGAWGHMLFFGTLSCAPFSRSVSEVALLS